MRQAVVHVHYQNTEPVPITSGVPILLPFNTRTAEGRLRISIALALPGDMALFHADTLTPLVLNNGDPIFPNILYTFDVPISTPSTWTLFAGVANFASYIRIVETTRIR